ncbi:MAG: hypothetical protein ABR961_05550 [Thermoanaerobaculaceae bacterium]|jgi:hypothetical protein
MARHCTVCTHPDRDAIDAALVGRDSYRGVARRFAVGPDAVERHAKAHLPTSLAKAHEVTEVTRADDLLAQVRELQAKAVTILETAERGGDLRSALGAIREARSCVELLGKLAGELQDGVTVNILVAPEWLALRGRILTALQPYAEAQLALAGVIDSDHEPRP